MYVLFARQNFSSTKDKPGEREANPTFFFEEREAIKGALMKKRPRGLSLR